MNNFENALLRYLQPHELKLIQKNKICIIGLGGLGSNAAVGLVRLGFKNITLIDFDCVDYSNLNRQFYFYDQVGIDKTSALSSNLLRINPDLKLNAVKVRVNRENALMLTMGCDMIIEALDKAEIKQEIIETLIPHKLLISASGLGNYWDINLKTINPTKNLCIVGDFTSDVENGIPPLYPGVVIASSYQVANILKKTLGGNNV